MVDSGNASGLAIIAGENEKWAFHRDRFHAEYSFNICLLVRIVWLSFQGQRSKMDPLLKFLGKIFRLDHWFLFRLPLPVYH